MVRISFIVIGRNEGWKLTKCLDSIYNAVSNLKMNDYEVIYVDSQSTDDSMERAARYKDRTELRILQLVEECNAAIGRNAGVLESKGETLCFLDGDMEINPVFLKEYVLNNSSNEIFISGQLENNYYDSNWNFLKAENLFQTKKLNIYDTTNGGAFIISRSLWELVKGMRTKFDRSQDVDLNYRLVKKGYKIFRYEMIYAKHHTIQYNYNTSLKKEFKYLRVYLFRGLLIRENIFNYKIWKRNFRINYTLFFLILTILSALIFQIWWLVIPYLILVIFRALIQVRNFKNVIRIRIFRIIFKYFYQDITGLLGMLFFFPVEKKINYVEIS